jgi:very-short-patch-repair endonuclease
MSDGEDLLAFHLKAAGILFTRQFYFAAGWPLKPGQKARKWAADFALADGLLVEVDGGVFVNGGHNRGKAYTDDRERDAEALCHGWRVLRVTTDQVESGAALAWIERALARP